MKTVSQMSEYKHKEMLKATVGDLISNTVIYDHETGEPLNLEEVDAEYRRTIGEIDEVYAKAKAFDKIMKVFEINFGATDSLAKLKVFTEVENAYIESGELE